ncbi:MAG TPA: hypothetical protein VM869_23145 [Enhygromyxa sp.]|nr:hypothetical protein [Enhygromyxa sp.]
MRGVVFLVLGFVLGSTASCFSAPDEDVMFACDLLDDDRCPPDYRCEADNCCHKLGSDVEANLGACAYGGNSGGTGETGSTETSGETGESG